MAVAQHRKFDLGINQDEASFLLPEGYIYSSKNVLFDKLGIARKRGGITGVGATVAYNGDQLGALTMDDGTVRYYSKGVTGNILNSINKGTGAFTLLGSSNFGDVILNGGGRGFSHYGFFIYPSFTANSAAAAVGKQVLGGSDGSSPNKVFGTPASVALTAGDKLVLCAAGDNALAMVVGQVFVATYAGPGEYIGRITRLVSTSSFEVYPTPTATVAACTAANSYHAVSDGTLSVGNGLAIIGGRLGMSYQSRICFGYCCRKDVFGANRLELYPRRVYFSSLQLEGDASGLNQYQGAAYLSPNGFPNYNYFDIPGQDPLTAMSPTGFGDALFFSPFRTFRLTGNLSTQYGTAQSITWAVKEIPNSVGCISERSMQRTPRGVIFAHDSGIYTTDGSSMHPLTFGRVTNYWLGLVSAGSFAIYGSALIRGNHYYICGTNANGPWALMINLDTLAWGIHTGRSSPPASWVINSAIQDPASASGTLAFKWWDEQGVAPTMPGGQLVQLDSMFRPTSTNRLDSDGQIVNFEILTRPYNEDSPMLQKQFRDATIEYQNLGGANVTAHPDYMLDSADVVAGGVFYYLPRQDSYTVTAASNATPIVITCGAHDIKQDTWVYVAGVTGNVNANGKFRVQAVTATTVTLMGSYGSGAYVSGGTIHQADSRDIPISALPGVQEGAGVAVQYRINDTDSGGAQGADQFELYGIMHTYDTRDPNVE